MLKILRTFLDFIKKYLYRKIIATDLWKNHQQLKYKAPKLRFSEYLKDQKQNDHPADIMDKIKFFSKKKMNYQSKIYLYFFFYIYIILGD